MGKIDSWARVDPVHDNARRTPLLCSANWRKSRYSNPSGDCIELAALGGGEVAVRDSLNPGGRILVYGRAGISAFIQAVRAGEFDYIID